MLCKIIHCAGCISANTLGKREMRTAILCTKCSQVQKVGSSSKAFSHFTQTLNEMQVWPSIDAIKTEDGVQILSTTMLHNRRKWSPSSFTAVGWGGRITRWIMKPQIMSSCLSVFSFSHLTIGYRPAMPTTYWTCGRATHCHEFIVREDCHWTWRSCHVADDPPGVGCCVVYVNDSCRFIIWILPIHYQQLSMQWTFCRMAFLVYLHTKVGCEDGKAITW